jgi:hypothetical protein
VRFPPVRFRRPHGSRLASALVVTGCVLLIHSAIAEPVVGARRRTALERPAAVTRPPAPRGRLFSPTSPFNRAISRSAPIDPRSDEYVAGMAEAADRAGFVIAVGRYTVPAYSASARTRRYRVALTASWAPRRAIARVPIPPAARPDPASDGHLAILDSRNGCEYDFWEAQKQGRTWTAAWGNATSFTGSGVYPGGLSARGSGFALLAGLMWPHELKSGRIDHALIFSYPYTSRAGFVSPATESDGESDRPDAMPEGARLQLDPTFDIRSLPRYERTIARALQLYGMYLADTGGNNVGLYAVNPQSYRRNPYRGVLPRGDYVDIRDIPIDRFRVIQLGSIKRNPGPARPSRCIRGAAGRPSR